MWKKFAVKGGKKSAAPDNRRVLRCKRHLSKKGGVLELVEAILVG